MGRTVLARGRGGASRVVHGDLAQAAHGSDSERESALIALLDVDTLGREQIDEIFERSTSHVALRERSGLAGLSSSPQVSSSVSLAHGDDVEVARARTWKVGTLRIGIWRRGMRRRASRRVGGIGA